MRPLEPFDGERRVIVAVSGGADSMALALLLSRWGRPLAVVVDHGLRPEAANEATLTVRRLKRLGVPATIRRAGLAPGSGGAERARAARYRLLLDVCRDTGRPDLLLAHHAGDQSETVRMRQERGSGPSGLAGMAPLDYRPHARLLRPLLPVGPERLRATMRAAGIKWVEDPTNHDPGTARGALRATLTAADRVASLALCAEAAATRREVEEAAGQQLRHVEIRPEGFAVVQHPLGPDALSALIWTVSGRPYPPPQAALAAGLATRTVAGVLLRPAGRLGPGTLVAREPAAVAAAEPARSGLIWDGRFRLGGTVPPGLTVGALGAEATQFCSGPPFPAVVRAGLPALRRNGVVWAVPHLGFPDAETCRSLAVEFWPTRPTVPASLCRELVNPSESRGV